MLRIEYLYLSNIILYNIFITVYYITITENKTDKVLFMHYTVVYVAVLAIHMIALIFTIISENRFCT